METGVNYGKVIIIYIYIYHNKSLLGGFNYFCIIHNMP